MTRKSGGDVGKRKYAPKSFAQAFLKLDAWCESTKGLNAKRTGGKIKGWGETEAKRKVFSQGFYLTGGKKETFFL